MIIVSTKTKKQYEFLPTRNGENQRACPECNDDRIHKGKKSFSYNTIKNVGYCQNCDTTFVEMKNEYKQEKSYKLPEPLPETKQYSEKMAAWFMNRGLWESTMKQFKIVEHEHFFPQIGKKRNAICLPYYRDGVLVNVKYRDSEKNFALESGAELIPFNLDAIKSVKQIIITEGEFDCMAIYQAGLHNVISVPNGATKSNVNLQWLDNTIDYFDGLEQIILATDKDVAGINLRTHLAARLGVEICMKVEFGDCKDANEYLVKYGEDALKQVIANAEPFPIEGAFTVVDVENELDNIFEHGLQKGYTINLEKFDDLMSFELGRLYTITGIPSHGKSKFVDFVLARLNLLYGLKPALFSPETYPIQLHISAYSELFSGKKFGKQTMPIEDYVETKKHINENFYWIMPEDNFTIDNILSKARQLVFRKGIQVLVIDPYNKIEHQMERGQNETQYISKFLDTLTNFAHKNNVMVFLVAHPRKMQKLQQNGLFEVPSLYDINGSANFYNKTDFGITVYRDMLNDCVQVHINKVKFRHLGELGVYECKYNFNNNRFSSYSAETQVVNYDNSNWLTDGLNKSNKMQPNRDFFWTSEKEDNSVPF